MSKVSGRNEQPHRVDAGLAFVPKAAETSFAQAIAITACVLSLLLVLFGWSLRPHASSATASAVAPLDPTAPVIVGAGFERDAVYPATHPPGMMTDVRRYGSWVGGDAGMGEVRSRWYRVLPDISLLVAGYVDGHTTQIILEGRTPSGGVEQLAVSPQEQPAEKWAPIPIGLSSAWTQFRIKAIDRSKIAGGWFGFSEPVIVSQDYAELAKQYFLLILSVAASFVVVLGPGVIVSLRLKKRGSSLPLFLLPLPGLLYAVALGLLAWKGPSFLHPPLVALVGVGLIAVALLIHIQRRNLSFLFSAVECDVLFVLLLIVVICTSKATYSLGPVGELYGGQISRSLEVGARSDSRINYHIVQMVALRDHAYGPVIARLLSPYNFSHRGPLAGLAASAIVLATPVQPSADFPNSAWQIFDREGFAVYRVAMMVISCCLLLPVFGLAKLFLSERASLLAFHVVVGAPFIIHEIYFTWPKIIAAGLVVIAACLAWERRYFYSGLLLGLAYLGHPSALLAAPALLALLLLRGPTARAVSMRWKEVFGGWMRQAAGAGILLLLWRVVNGRRYAQDGFLSYFKMAENLPPTLPNWLHVRWLSLRNTVVPLHLYLFDAHNSAIVWNGPPLPVLTFFLQDWTSLPSGVGLLLYPCVLYWLILGWRYTRAWFLLIVILPLSFFVIYWGAFTTGLLREGLHVWVIGVLCFALWCWQAHDRSQRWWAYASAALLLRGVETLGMMLMPAVVTNRRLWNENFKLSDIVSLAVLVSACFALYTLTFRLSERLRRDHALESDCAVPCAETSS